VTSSTPRWRHDPGAVLDDVTTFAALVKDGAYMAGDRRVHHTERSKRRRAGGTPRRRSRASTAGRRGDGRPCLRYEALRLFHSDDPAEAAKFVVSDAVSMLWESVLRHDGFAAFTRRVPEQLIMRRLHFARMSSVGRTWMKDKFGAKIYPHRSTAHSGS
jgi:hypothetical protein